MIAIAIPFFFHLSFSDVQRDTVEFLKALVLIVRRQK